MIREEIINNVYKILEHAGYDNVSKKAVEKLIYEGLKNKEEIIELVRDKINENLRIEKKIEINNNQDLDLKNLISMKVYSFLQKNSEYFNKEYTDLTNKWDIGVIIQDYMLYMLQPYMIYLDSNFCVATDIKIYYYNKENK